MFTSEIKTKFLKTTFSLENMRLFKNPSLGLNFTRVVIESAHVVLWIPSIQNTLKLQHTAMPNENTGNYFTGT